MFIKYGDNNPIDVNPKDFIDKTSNVESFDIFEKTIYLTSCSFMTSNQSNIV